MDREETKTTCNSIVKKLATSMINYDSEIIFVSTEGVFRLSE